MSHSVKLLVVFCVLANASCAVAGPPASSEELRRFDVPEATQGVAVDDRYFYAIDDSVIAKYDKESGQFVKRWTATEELPLKHLNAGVVIDGKLYCANSNYPQYPEASSVEIWDVDTLEHVGTHSFGIYEGSLTWVDRHEGAWWAVFAHYTEKVNDDPHARDARWTSLVRFDDQWRRTGGWTFPAEVIARFEPDSCSGGAVGRRRSAVLHGPRPRRAIPTGVAAGRRGAAARRHGPSFDHRPGIRLGP